SWGDSKEDNDDESNDDSKGDDDKADSDDDGNSDDDDNERTDSDDDYENPSFTLKDYDEEEHDEEKCDEKTTDADQNVSQEKSYEQVIEDTHVTLTSLQKTESSKQSSYVSFDFASKFLILENVPPAIDEVASMMNVKIRQDESSTLAPSLFTVPMTVTQKLLLHMLQPVSTLEMELSQLKQADHSAPLLEYVKSQLPKIVDDLLSTRFGYATRTTLQSYTKEFEKKAQEERKLYIDVVEKSSTIMESLENVVLAKSSSQPQSTYEAAASLIEFKLKKILLEKLEKSKLYQAANDHKNLYDELVKSYQVDKDLFDSYGKAYSLKRSREDKDKDEDPPAGPDQGLKKKKTSKDADPSRGSKSKESKSSSFKGSKSQSKSFGKSA
ncbi:hypothetical protein Tco_1298715, partial [Tanacetum coccineum]